MRAHDRNYIIAFCVLLIALFVIVQVERAGRAVGSSKQFSTFPSRIGEWEGKDIALEEETYEILGTRDVLVREYKDSQGDSLVLAVIYSATDRSSFHPPGDMLSRRRSPAP